MQPLVHDICSAASEISQQVSQAAKELGDSLENMYVETSVSPRQYVEFLGKIENLSKLIREVDDESNKTLRDKVDEFGQIAILWSLIFRHELTAWRSLSAELLATLNGFVEHFGVAVHIVDSRPKFCNNIDVTQSNDWRHIAESRSKDWKNIVVTRSRAWEHILHQFRYLLLVLFFSFVYYVITDRY
jgi:hypothetical protein